MKAENGVNRKVQKAQIYTTCPLPLCVLITPFLKAFISFFQKVQSTKQSFETKATAEIMQKYCDKYKEEARPH